MLFDVARSGTKNTILTERRQKRGTACFIHWRSFGHPWSIYFKTAVVRCTMIIEYGGGTILLKGAETTPDYAVFDERSGCHRAPGHMYRDIKALYESAEDRVFQGDHALTLRHSEKLRTYQLKAVEHWLENNGRGTIVLPTAAGKTHIGIEAISRLSTTTLVIAPTIELVQQWREKITSVIGTDTGQIGGGVKEIRPVTVSTYDSAYLMAEKLGNMFRFLLVDEVHHLASTQFIQIAKMFAAPHRLGLTATYERVDMLHETLGESIGGKIFEMGYEELRDYIADYEIVRIPVDLTPEEEEEYEQNHQLFLAYLRKQRIRLAGPWDFEKFIMRSWNMEGREALLAWRRAREIAFNARVKVDAVRYVLSRHRHEKVLIFSEDTGTAYLISKEFLVPALTYLTPGPERKRYLDMFRTGDISALATSRVLDEGVDVPDASVGIVLSGSGSTRQFRQRLGRILRPGEGKKAVMYEIISRKTSEFGTSARRRRGVPVSTDSSEKE